MGYIEEVHKFVRQIPRGKVTTYGALAQILNAKLQIINEGKITPRMVGRVLSQNKDPQNIPCHRVVRSDGGLAGYAFGGVKEKRKILEKEDVDFNKEKVNLKVSLWEPSL